MPLTPGPKPLDPHRLEMLLGEAAEALDRPVFVLHDNAVLAWTNAAGRRLLAAPGAVWRHDGDGRIVPSDPSALPEWRRALASAPTTGELAGRLPAAHLRRLDAPDPDQPSRLLLLMPGADAAVINNASWADYARSFALSATEAALLPALAGAERLSQVALGLGVPLVALRRPLRSIRRKTQHSALADLRRELRALPPLQPPRA
jgi:hypothetical protein